MANEKTEYQRAVEFRAAVYDLNGDWSSITKGDGQVFRAMRELMRAAEMYVAEHEENDEREDSDRRLAVTSRAA